MARRKKESKRLQNQVKQALNEGLKNPEIIGYLKGQRTGEAIMILGRKEKRKWALVMILLPKGKKIRILEFQETTDTSYGKEIRAALQEKGLGEFIAK